MIFARTLSAQTAQELFLRANEQYRAGDFDTALATYQKISPKGAAVWYNMGNCAFQKNDQARATLYWQRALNNEPRTILFAQILFFCLIGVLLFLVRKMVRAKQRAALICLNTLVILVGSLNYALYASSLTKKALTMQEKVTVHAGPGTEYHALGTIACAQKVTVKEQRQTWSKITGETYTGWVPTTAIEII
jgi:tetratricopeptide (TPR) repeat protein